MGLLKKIKKKKVPQELPDLAIDKLKEELKKSERKSRKTYRKELEEKETELPSLEENSFFNKLLTELNQEIDNLDGLENWYHNKFLPQDTIGEMKGYWEHQKKDIILKTIGKNYKEKILEQIKKMEELEKDWQDIYFELMEKEEEIKKEEEKLKKTISEFVEIVKKKTNQ